MRVRLLLFAGLREAVGAKEHLLECEDGARLGEVIAAAEAALPALARWRGRLVVSLNESRLPLSSAVRDGDEIALLPPVSGGGLAALRSARLSLDEVVESVRSPGCGGIVTFTGVVRDHSRGQRILHLEYEAYEPMAEAEMQRISGEVCARWPEARIALTHRVGRLEIGEAAVMIAVAAPHRAQAFEACRYAIDALKRSVPIWKKEFGAEGTCWVEENP
jgi:molybdopterin synthase catalytic subunit